jgi:hypothetical protein
MKNYKQSKYLLAGGIVILSLKMISINNFSDMTNSL